MKQLEYVSPVGSAVVLGFPAPILTKDLWMSLVPEYRSVNHGPATFTLEWDRSIGQRIAKISQKRSSSRVSNYILTPELSRVEQKLAKGQASIRFGNLKPGHGYSGERGDFCLIAGVITKRRLTVYYRSLEMIGGFAYDLTLLNFLEEFLRCDWKAVTFVTQKCFVFALKGNSNEKLYPKLRRILAA